MNSIREITARITAYQKTLSLGGSDKYEILNALEKMQGYQIDTTKMKTIQYFKLIDKLEKQNA